jgi:hypothetical protein
MIKQNIIKNNMDINVKFYQNSISYIYTSKLGIIKFFKK